MSFVIWKEHQFYTSTFNAPADDFIWDGLDPLRFDSEDDAQAWIDEAQDGTYHLSHGESGRPDYTVFELLDVEQDWENERTIYRLEREGQQLFASQSCGKTEWSETDPQTKFHVSLYRRPESERRTESDWASDDWFFDTYEEADEFLRKEVARGKTYPWDDSWGWTICELDKDDLCITTHFWDEEEITS